MKINRAGLPARPLKALEGEVAQVQLAALHVLEGDRGVRVQHDHHVRSLLAGAVDDLADLGAAEVVQFDPVNAVLEVGDAVAPVAAASSRVPERKSAWTWGSVTATIRRP